MSSSSARDTALAPPLTTFPTSARHMQSSVSLGNGKCKRTDAEEVKPSVSHCSSKHAPDLKPPATISAFVGMTGAVSGLTTSLNQSASLLDTSIIQQATSLISKRAGYLLKGDKGLLFQYYA